MSTELSKPIQIVSPVTGEVLTLDSPTDSLGHLLADIREHESLIREMKGVVSAEVLRRMDRDAKWTIPGPKLELKCPQGGPVPAEEWDGAELRERLCEFVDAGELSIEAVDAAIQIVVSYKVHKSGINALRRLGGEIAEAVEACRSEVPKKRYVSVTRA